MNVTQLINDNGNPAAYHYVISCNDGAYVLQSYDSLVAKIDRNGTITFGPNWDYSATTLRHLKTFIGSSLTKKELQKRVDTGTIEVTEITTN